MPNEDKRLKQCTRCGFLKGGIVSDKPCTSADGTHKFKVLDAAILGGGMGTIGGGRPKVYATEEERRQARLDTFNRSNAKRRGKTVTETEGET